MGRVLFESTVDLTVVVNCHREEELLRPTLNSIDKSISFAISNGVKCELLIIADNPSEGTILCYQQWSQDKTQNYKISAHISSEGNPGGARNFAAKLAKGKYLGFCDGDDLVSENYLYESIRALELKEEPSIAHPEYVISFGDWSGVWHISPAETKQSYRDLISENLWCSSSVARTSTFLKVPYAPLSANTGFGPEDWHWNIQTTQNGFQHFSVPNTCFFYRKKSDGVNNTHKNSLLPPIDIYALSRAMPYRPKAFVMNKSAIRSLATNGYVAAKTRMSWLRKHFPRFSNFLYLSVRRIYSTIIQVPTSQLGSAAALGETKYSAEIKEQIKKATWLEPAISWTAFGLDRLHVHSQVDSTYAEILEKLLEDLGSTPKRIIAVPWVGIGGADLVSINYAEAFGEIDQNDSKKVVILSTGAPEKSRIDLIPSGVKFVQIDPQFQSLSEENRSRLIAQAITIAQPELIVSVNCFDLVNSLRRFGKQVTEKTSIFLTFFAFDRIGDNYPTQPITDGSRDFLKYISGILTDNRRVAKYLSDLLGKPEDFFKVHYQPAFGNQIQIETDSFRSFPIVDNQEIRLLWPHRLDKEKRPEVLTAIAEAAAEERIPLSIDVFGQAVMGDFSKSLFAQFKDFNIHYQGPYQGGLSALPTKGYHGLLLTSESEGMPIVILQSMMLGLPVIATDVGGIGEVITHEESGFLVSSPEDIDGFVSSIKQLQDISYRDEIIANARNAVASQHSWKAFVQNVKTLLP